MDDASGASPDPTLPPDVTAGPIVPGNGPGPISPAGSGAGLQMQPCYRHPAQFTGVHCTRCGRPICVDCMRPAAVGYQCPECLATEQSSGYRPRRGVASLRTPPRVTQVLIAINVAVFIVEIVTGGRLDASFTGAFFSSFAQKGAMWPRAIAIDHQYYRLFTSMFLHGGVLHLALNMYVLWVLGSVIEPAFGPRRFLAIYLIAGLFGSVASFMFSGVDVFGVGASGAIFGLLGAWVAYNLRRRGTPAATAQLRWALFWIGINLVIGFSFSGIDNLAHIGGLIGGLAAGFIAEGFGSRKDDVTIQIAGFAGLLIVAIALIAFRVATFPAVPGITGL